MCRIVYVYDKQGHALVKSLNLLSILEDISGGDGFGFGVIENNTINIYTNIGLIKQDHRCKELMFGDDHKYTQCLAMTRFSTVGKVNLNNQQPIPITHDDEIVAILVHNGTLYPHRYPEIGHERPKYDDKFIKDKLLWKEHEEESDTWKIAKTLSEYAHDPEYYFKSVHPPDQTVMVLYKDGSVYAHRGHNPLRYFGNDRFLLINNQWGKDLDRGTYVVDRLVIKRL